MKKLAVIFLLFNFILAEDGRVGKVGPKVLQKTIPGSVEKIGDYPFPTNPINDRAKGYLLQGKVKNAITNYGGFIDWDNHPAGLWGDYTYLPNVSFLSGVPGKKYTSDFTWFIYETISNGGEIVRQTWVSEDAYDAWFENGDTIFVSVLFESEDDDGIWRPDSVAKVSSMDLVNDYYQWGIDEINDQIFLSALGEADPNNSGSRMGLIYPWALRPELKERADDFDIYDYGEDKEEWTDDDVLQYYGVNVDESWFTRTSGKTNSDWQASTKARVNTHNTETTSGDIFGDTPFTDPSDTYPLLAP